MNAKDRERWEKIRAKGRAQFIVLYGVFAWGITGGLSFSIARALVSGEPLASMDFLSGLLLSLIVFCIGGAVWAAWAWGSNEKKYLGN